METWLTTPSMAINSQHATTVLVGMVVLYSVV